MNARERILTRLRSAQQPSTDDVDGYIRDRARGPAPSPDSDPSSRFLQCAARLGSDVARVDTVADVPAAVVRYLDAHQLPRRAVAWPEILKLPWEPVGLTLDARVARADDAIGVTGAFAAIVETGTLMLLSGSTTPATVSLLPETHIAIVTKASLVATMEDAWARMRAMWGPIPRAVNFVSGPSRTADVEQTVTLGAHGPRRVLIVLVGN